jgi:hypothetical protein
MTDKLFHIKSLSILQIVHFVGLAHLVANRPVFQIRKSKIIFPNF